MDMLLELLKLLLFEPKLGRLWLSNEDIAECMVYTFPSVADIITTAKVNTILRSYLDFSKVIILPTEDFQEEIVECNKKYINKKRHSFYYVYLKNTPHQRH